MQSLPSIIYIHGFYHFTLIEFLSKARCIFQFMISFLSVLFGRKYMSNGALHTSICQQLLSYYLMTIHSRDAVICVCIVFCFTIVTYMIKYYTISIKSDKQYWMILQRFYFIYYFGLQGSILSCWFD